MEEKVIRKTIEDLLADLKIEGDVELVLNEAEGVVDVALQTTDSGIVIGYHGEILESLQLILSLCLSKKIGSFVRVTLEVGDYRKQRTEWLTQMAQDAKKQALTEGRDIALPQLKSWERRIVHLLLKEDQEVVSESVGFGRDRTLVVKPKV